MREKNISVSLVLCVEDFKDHVSATVTYVCTGPLHNMIYVRSCMCLLSYISLLASLFNFFSCVLFILTLQDRVQITCILDESFWITFLVLFQQENCAVYSSTRSMFFSVALFDTLQT